MPGVLSARWSGKPKDDDRNNSLLLDQLDDVPDERRTAQFRCTIALVHAGGELTVDGVMEGRVIRERRGEGGFGYDSLFVADDTPDGRTSAQLTPGEKDAISHRGRALREIAPRVVAALSS
jgi:XTP/dITP diphosphohydrolase